MQSKPLSHPLNSSRSRRPNRALNSGTNRFPWSEPDTGRAEGSPAAPAEPTLTAAQARRPAQHQAMPLLAPVTGNDPERPLRRALSRRTDCTGSPPAAKRQTSLQQQEACGEVLPDKEAYLPLSRTTDRVLQILLKGDLSRLRAENVAESLGISCTTLRRRLRNDHTSYQFLLDRARQYRCESRLRDRWLPGKCFAEELGYLEVNSFYRAFRRWTGLSYSEYKETYH